ncbi:MAG: carbohydrate kinase family protein [bacterium]|nr:carbohydrate kinase family protein [bacterium]
MFDVVTFGSATRDLFIRSKEFKTLKNKEFITGQGICFNLGSKIYLDDMLFTTGGGGTNAAATFAKQGFKTAYIGRIGKDSGGRAIKEELKDLRVVSFISEDNKLKTAYSIIISVSQKERTILVYNGACHYLSVKGVPFAKLKAKWFYIAGLSGKSAQVLLPIIDFAKKNKIKVVLNPGAAQLNLGLNGLKNILNTVDVLILNQEEGAKLAELPFEKEKEIFKKLDKFVRGIVVMTKGPKGVVVSDGKCVYSAGTFKEKRYVDRTGAGDAFGSGFVSGLIRTNKIEEAIKLGSANGTAVVEELGAKNGLLTKARFEKEPRWKKFKITKIKL